MVEVSKRDVEIYSITFAFRSLVNKLASNAVGGIETNHDSVS